MHLSITLIVQLTAMDIEHYSLASAFHSGLSPAPNANTSNQSVAKFITCHGCHHTLLQSIGSPQDYCLATPIGSISTSALPNGIAWRWLITTDKSQLRQPYSVSQWRASTAAKGTFTSLLGELAQNPLVVAKERFKCRLRQEWSYSTLAKWLCVSIVRATIQSISYN